MSQYLNYLSSHWY